MKRIIIAALFLAFIAAIPAHAQVLHQVHVGGPDVCASFGLQPGCDANFSLVAVEFANGRVAGQYTDRFGGGGGFGFHAAIDCIAIEGNDAWVSGVITTGTALDIDTGEEIDLAGLSVITRVRDNGTSANDPPDEISFSFIDIPPSCEDKPDLPLFAAPQGQVAVK